jgi:hypothetical protein
MSFSLVVSSTRLIGFGQNLTLPVS